MRLMQPFLNRGINVTVDNFFTSLQLAKELKAKKTSLVGTVNKARREIPKSLKVLKDKLYETKFLKHEDTGATLTVYQGKKKKNVMILSTLHPSINIENNEKKTPETVRFYNQTKYGVDIIDQMARKYSVKAPSRRWPVHTFYNLLDLAAINAWIIYKEVTGETKLSRQAFIQLLANELRQDYLSAKNEKKRKPSRSQEIDTGSVSVKRRKCEVKLCKGNMTFKNCLTCKKMVCGKCSARIDYTCKTCILEN